MRARRSDQRTRDLAAIHVAAKKLRLDRGTYESILMRVSGVRSCADLDAVGRAKVLDEFRRLGAPANARTKGRPANTENEPMLRKIEALLAEISAPWSYADAIAKQMFGIPFVAWCRNGRQLRAIIAALDARRLKLRDIKEAACSS
jgi:phage gp16-like protein